MECRVDGEFDRIAMMEIMPLISKAFCILNANTRDNVLMFDDKPLLEKINRYKAEQLKTRLSEYIDSLACAFINQ